MIAWLTDTMPPAPMPCSTRARTSCSMFCARAQKSEARVNSAVPVRIIRRLPYRSPSLP
ncbi:hypothetical protein D3C75_1239140 [compost metagenome]